MRKHWPLSLALFAACSGSGSDVGPSLANLPPGRCRATALDDLGAGAVGARVSVGGATAVIGRSGRGELFADPRGLLVVEVAADSASAAAADRLVGMRVALDVVGPDLPSAIHLPDTAQSPELVLPTGVALPALALDDTAGTGAVVDVPAGVHVADGAEPEVVLRVGALAALHLPAALPSPAANGEAWLTTRAFWIDPPTATFAPGASLAVPDELSLPGADSARLWRLDHASGLWQQVAGDAQQVGSRLVLAGGVTHGGLYVYAAQRPAATVRGRVLDEAGRAVFGALVRVDSWIGMTQSDGRFAALAPASDAAGNPRAASIEVRGGPLWLPVTTTAFSPMLAAGGDFDLGDLELATVPVSNVRIQAIRRGRGESARRIVSSGGLQSAASVGFTDGIGQCLLEDVPSGYFGFTAGYPFDVDQMFLAEAAVLLPAGRRWQDNYAFFDDRGYVLDGRTTRALVIDSYGTGPVQGASVIEGRTPGEGLTGTTREGGVVFVGRDFGGRATASLRSERQGGVTIGAFSIEEPNGDRLELPVLRQPTPEFGAFDRHGVVAGDLVGFDPAKSQRLLASRPLEIDEWFDSRLLDLPGYAVVPTRLGGALPPGAYRAGVALPRGNVVVAEGTSVGGVFSLTALGVAFDLVVPEGTTIARDLSLDLPADTTFAAPLALRDLDPAFAPSDLRCDFALLRPDGRVVEAARRVGGNHTAVGEDLQFLLPALEGPLSGCSWLVAMSAGSGQGGAHRVQGSLLRLSADGAESFALLPPPSIASPSPAASVAADGFAVQFALPAGTLYATVELRGNGPDQLQWMAVVPGDATEFTFVRLPNDVPTPLEAGIGYTLTVSAFRADVGPLIQRGDPYQRLTTCWQSLGAAERGVRALSSISIQVAAN